MSAPAVTVLMPVHNGGPYLEEAMASIFRQTHSDFELLVVDDGSDDATPSILRACTDSRLSIIRNERNLGLIASLNEGLETARGEFVARMDADDVALPARLERQVDLLRRSPQTGLCGTWFRMIGGTRSTIVKPPTRPDDMAARLFHESPLGHPTVMFRRALFEQHGLHYSADYPDAEDFELWTRVAQVTELANLPEVLLLYRQHDEQVSSRKEASQEDSVKKIVLRQLRRIYSNASPTECENHVAIVRNRRPDPAGLGVEYVESWLTDLARRNDLATAGFPPSAFRRVIGMLWWRYCSSRSTRPGIIKAFYASDLTRGLPLKNKLGMLAVRTGAMAGWR
jgi:glycosyltransferase involved in cell wall biosynthesis